MAAKLMLLNSTRALKSRLLQRSASCTYVSSPYLQLVRRYSSVEEEKTLQSSENSFEDAEDLHLSDRCVKRLRKLFADDNESFLRVSIEGGGCSGYKYTFDIDSKIAEDDRIIERDGARVIVDEVSLEYLKGSTIDYHEELIRSAFRISLNPRAEKGCSCGSSFTFKL